MSRAAALLTTPRQVLLRELARQYRCPHGPAGGLAVRSLDRRNRVTITAAVEALGLRPGEAVADVGFGGGLELELMLRDVGRTGRVYGVEVSTVARRHARRRLRAAVGTGTLRLDGASLAELPLPDASVDAVATVNTLYFVADLDRVCAELARVVRPSGRVLIGLFDPEAMSATSFAAYGFTLHPIARVVAAMRTASLDPVRHTLVLENACHLLLGQAGRPPVDEMTRGGALATPST
jgi:ubiquinone/menaquinone biosynthesis C-methylase UbiE